MSAQVAEHWYELASAGRLRQGDIFRNLLVVQFNFTDNFEPSRERDSFDIPLRWMRSDVIILDASCDVDHSDQRQPACEAVLMAAVTPANPETLRATGKEYDQRLETLRQGLLPSKFLLPEVDDETLPFPLSFVEYRERFLLPHSYLLANLGVRPRHLKSPHRERFGNWVGQCVSRVGPEDQALIPRFTSQMHPAQVLRAIDGA